MRPLHALLPSSAAPFTRRHAAPFAPHVGLSRSLASSRTSTRATSVPAISRLVSRFAMLAMIVASSASHAHAQARETLLLASDAPEAGTLAELMRLIDMGAVGGGVSEEAVP